MHPVLLFGLGAFYKSEQFINNHCAEHFIHGLGLGQG